MFQLTVYCNRTTVYCVTRQTNVHTIERPYYMQLDTTIDHLVERSYNLSQDTHIPHIKEYPYNILLTQLLTI